jgi:pimeloyl-ACP methyl ester carboxylesterase
VAARRAVELATSSSDKASIATAPYDLSGLDLPLVIGWATSSMASAVDGYRELARRLQLRTVEIVGAGHMAHRTHPEEFAGFVRTVLSTAAA